MLYNHRFNNQKDYSQVKVYVYELKKLGCNSGPLLWSLKEAGEIDYDKDGNFKSLKPGPIRPDLLLLTRKRPKVVMPLTPLHVYMMKCLLRVSLPVAENLIPVYFKAFLDYRHKHLETFFTVDGFSQRVHTPVVNIKTHLRHQLLIDNERIVSLDVKQMQPTILGRVLQERVGDNSFSKAIDEGIDVYVLLQRDAGVSTRAEAKIMLFRLIFGKPMDEIGSHFKGDTSWVDWINYYKSTEEPRNPHKEDRHTNLAWLLQHEEVVAMTSIWEALRRRRVPFLTIHDDVLVKLSDKDIAYKIFQGELKHHFRFFRIVVTTDGDDS